jgi:REP element-mobilizing transposase RayT
MSQITLLPETVYHVYTHANGFENLFNSDENFKYFLKKYIEYIHPIAETYAYCLMPNHIHFMIKIRSELEILEFIRLKQLNKLNNAGFKNQSDYEERDLQGFKTLGEFSINTSRQFNHLFNAFTQAFNKMHNRKGEFIYP